MAVKNYLINDKWLDIDKQNIVEVKSTDGVIGSIKLNGEEYGGGGSSDFSTAEVTVINTTSNHVAASVVAVMDTPISAIVPFNTIERNSNRSYIVPLYKGLCCWQIDVSVSVSGNISYKNGYVNITGDGTITIS